jgi:hypothetical protein
MIPKIMIDSGAYSARTVGTSIDLMEYIAFIKRNEVDAYINLDIIPDSHRPELIEQAAAASYRNQQAMKAAGLTPIPVFHQGERFYWLERMLADGERYIALAPAKGRDPRHWLDDVFTLLSDSKGQPLVKVHGLGITTHKLLRRYRWTSVDSSTWIKQSRVGQIPVPLYQDAKPNYSLRHDTFAITDRARGRNCRHLADGDDFDRERVVRFLKEKVGIDVADACVSFEHRCRVWLTFFKALEAHYRIPIFIVTNTNQCQQDILNECQVQHRLLSFARLKERDFEALAGGNA